MSLTDMRARWLRSSRALRAGEAPADSFVVAATFTAEPLIPYLGVEWMADGASVPAIRIAPYDQLFQVCFDWQTMFADRAPTAIILLWRIEDYLRAELLDAARGAPAGLARALDKLAELRAALAQLRRTFSGTVVVSLPPFPHGPDHDIRAARTASTVGAFHRRIIDAWIAATDEIAGISLLDLDACQRTVGIETSYDPRKWYLYRQPYTEEFWHAAAGDLARILKRQRGAAKKCLIVDCDNTLWGGIVGEDGLTGIALGQDFPGSAFRDFQNQLLTLRSKGVMLALCSKNNEADVWEVFERHDGMIVKREHFVAHRINWLDKPTNIESIAKELNIGLDSLVFVDDSSIEIEQVRSRLPMLTCLQVPTDLARFASTMNAFRLFDRETISDEDRVRSDMMLQERERTTLAAALSAEEFTQALQLSVDVFAVEPEHVARVTQLTNKTNQFNLTTRRKTAGEIAALCAAPDADVLAWRVTDRFGDYGLVGVAILRTTGEDTEIDTFLMSCRVLGRGVENAVFAALAGAASRRGARRLLGRYLPTPKNSLVANLYRDHGFRPLDDDSWLLHDLTAPTWPTHIARPGL